MAIKYGLLIAFGVCTSTFVHAETCSNPQTQMKMNECADKDLEQDTKTINALYKNIRSRLDEADQLHLKNLQLKWIRAKDAACKNEAAEYEGGSIQAMIWSNCLSKQTKQRIVWLKSNY